MLVSASLAYQVSSLEARALRADDSVRLTDGMYYMLMAREFWFGARGDIYNLNTQLAVLYDATGLQLRAAMPVNILPTALVILLPSSALVDVAPVYAQTLMSAISLALLIVSLIVILESGSLPGRSAWQSRALLLVCVLSGATYAGIALGQTAILHTASLLLLAFRPHTLGPRRESALDVGLLFLLAMKPQSWLLGAGVLVLRGRHRQAVLGSAGVLATLAVLTPRLGLSWPLAYLTTLRLYQGAHVPAAYQGGFALGLMNVFRTAFSGVIGSAAATNASWVLLVGGYLAVLAKGVLGTRNQDPSRLIQLIVGIYLLFSPHSGFYEELLLAVVLAPVVVRSGRLPLALFLPTLAALFVLVNRVFLPLPDVSPIVWWALKAAFVLTMLTHAWGSPHPRRLSLSN